MGKFARSLSAIIILSIFSLPAIHQVQAADRMFFSGISSLNQSTGQMDVVIVWGELEGKIPSEIQKFNIYRKSGSGSYSLIHTGVDILNQLAAPSQIRALFNEAGEGKQRNEIIAMLSEAYPGTDSSNYHVKLHEVMNSGGPDYNPLQKQFLSRYSRNAARALGRAFIDRNVPAGTYTYMVTGILSDLSQTNPLGRFTIDTGTETILPDPVNFEQVRIGGCSETRKNIDHARIHLNWEIPSTPELMSIRSLIYGYDIYRSSTDLGSLNLCSTIPSGLDRVNEVPIIASGNAPSEGLGAFLAKDDGNALTGGEGLIPGDVYYYYLVARDLAGNYSHTAGPVKAIVPDTRPPVVPWNVHSQREQTGSAPFTPRLTLLWDRVSAVNYLKQYSTGKEICNSSPTEVCHVQSPNTCESFNPLCVDLDVVQYLVFRFDSFKDATEWGPDSDQDLWPDAIEDIAGTDPCDQADHPSGNPPGLVAQIMQNDSSHIRTLASGKKIMVYQDPVPAPDNRVHWYRISTMDPSGNISPLSPPARAALWDRSQPDVNGTIRGKNCNFIAKHYRDNVEPCDEPCEGNGEILTILDKTGLATRFKLYEVCGGSTGAPYNRLIYSGDINGRRCLTRGDEIPAELCDPQCSQGKYIVKFYGGKRLAVVSEPFELNDGLCEEKSGCVVLFEDCQDVEITLTDPGFMPPLLPGNPLEICVELEPGECAKVYQKIQENYSPVLSFCNTSSTTMEICDFLDIEGIVTMDACLGLRIFSANHVGSSMGYFKCIPVLSGLPQPPLLESVKKSGTESSPSFELRWSAQSEGIAAFIIQRKGETSTIYETVWDLDPDAGTGQFVYEMPIAPGQIEDEWCFKVKVVDSAFQMSNWSSALCEIWGEKQGVVSLPWPEVTEPADGGGVTAFYLTAEDVGAIVLSDDVTLKIDAFFDAECNFNEPPICGTKGCLRDIIACRCNICSSIKSWNNYDQFVVYRQEENKDYVQVSPLVETIHCLSSKGIEQCDGLPGSHMDDPMVFLVGLPPGSISGVSGAVKTELETTQRLIFVDWYPHKAGATVRYHLMKISRAGGEPEKVFTSDWIEMK